MVLAPVPPAAETTPIQGQSVSFSMVNKAKELRAFTGLSQQKFADKYHIPLRTLQSWEGGERDPALYIIELLERAVKEDFSGNEKK